MSLWFEVTRIAAAFNVLLLLGLVAIWTGNYRQFRSKHTLGLLIFALLMLAENGLALYFFTFHPMLHPWFTEMPGPPTIAVMLLRVLTTGALLFLAWVTWD